MKPFPYLLKLHEKSQRITAKQASIVTKMNDRMIKSRVVQFDVHNVRSRIRKVKDSYSFLLTSYYGPVTIAV